MTGSSGRSHGYSWRGANSPRNFSNRRLRCAHHVYRSWLPGTIVTRPGSSSQSASARRAARNSSGRAVVVRSPVIRMWSGSRPRTRSTSRGTPARRKRPARPASREAIPCSRLPISRSGLNSYCQKWMSERWTMRTDPASRYECLASTRGREDLGRASLPASRHTEVARQEASPSQFRPHLRDALLSRSSPPGNRTRCACRRRSRSRGSRRPRRRRPPPSTGRRTRTR